MPAKPPAKGTANHSRDRTNYPWIFVEGFCGWGEDNKAYAASPYWGLSTGNMIDALNASGYTAACPGLSPQGSVWDRACELYAAITGTRVDYGMRHSEKYGHPRYGKDYTGRAAVREWDSKHKINLVGHSLGAPTIAMFVSLLTNGAPEEIEASGDGTVSPLFTGGKGNYVHSVTGIAGAFNGSTLGLWESRLTGALYKVLYPISRGGLRKQLSYLSDGDVAAPDTALYDLYPDRMADINKTLATSPDVYYFAVPCCMTVESKIKGRCVSDRKAADYAFVPTANMLGRPAFSETRGGMLIGKEWLPNDGVVNTISQYGPFTAAKNELNRPPSPDIPTEAVKKGVYNVFEIYRGSHNALVGNNTRPNKNAYPYLLRLIALISSLED